MVDIKKFIKYVKIFDLISINIYKNVFDNFSRGNKTFNINIKNTEDVEILIEYVSYFISNGGITNFEFNKSISYSSNFVLLEAFINKFNKNNDDKNMLLNIKKIIKETFNKKIKNTINDELENYENNNFFQHLIATENAIEKIDYDDKYIGLENNNGNSDICVRVMFLGVIYSDDLDKMIDVVIKMTKLTHNNIVSMMSAVISAYFVYLSVNKIEIEKWIFYILELIGSEKIKKYFDLSVNANMAKYIIVLKYWDLYKNIRFDEKKIKKTKSDNNLLFKIKFYGKFVYNWTENYTNNFILQGEDCVSCNIIVYDVLLNSNGNIEKCIYYGLLIAGQVVSIGGLLGGLYSLLYNNDEIIDKFIDKIKD